jgi:hypothetical protein
VIEGNRRSGKRLVPRFFAISRATMIPDHPQHGFAILLMARKGAELAGHLGRGCVGNPRQDRGDGARDRAPLARVVGNTSRHQESADIGIAQPERTVVIRQQRDFLRRELRHHHRDFQHDGPQPDRMLERMHVEALGAVFAVFAERHQVQRGEIARRIVQEHVFRARIGGADFAARRAGVPIVDRGVELDAGIGAGPRGVRDLLPQLARFQALVKLLVLAPGQFPVGIVGNRIQESVGHANRVVRVLARDRQVGFRIPIGVVDPEFDAVVTLLGEGDHALDVIVGNAGFAAHS